MRIAIVPVLLLAACTEASDPARLDHAQILAVRAEPPHIAPGQSARIDVLASDDAGRVFEAQPDTVAADGVTVERTADGLFVTAGPSPGAVPLQISLEIGGIAWRAEKLLGVTPAPAANPRVVAMQVDGVDATMLVADAGSEPALAARGEGAEPLTYAWYSSAGDLEHYRKPDATLLATEPASGTIVVVVRDAVGGVTWQTLPATVR